MYYNKTPAEVVRVAVPAGVFILKYARETAGGRSSALLPDQMIEKTARSSLSLNTGELSKFFTCDHLFFIADTYCETSQVIFVFRHQSRMLCCLTADQSCI